MSDVEAVGAVVAEQALAEGTHIVAVAVKDHDGLLATGQHEDIVVGVHGHAWAFLEVDAVGQLGPVLDEFVSKVTYAINFWHFLHPFVADLPVERPRSDPLTEVEGTIERGRRAGVIVSPPYWGVNGRALTSDPGGNSLKSGHFRTYPATLVAEPPSLGI